MPLLYERLRAHLLDEIRSGRLGPGDRIPSEMALAEQFNVSRITSKKALETLEHDGLIVRFRGKGSFVAEGVGGAVTAPATHTPRAAAPLGERGGGAVPTIGFVLPHWSDVFGTGMLMAIEERASELDYTLAIKRSYGRRDVEDQAINTLVSLGVRGLIVFPVHGEYYNDSLLRIVLDGYPVVLVDRYMKGIAVNSVGTDNCAAALEITNLLIAQGHTRIAFLSLAPERTSSIEDRRRGFGTALRQANLSYDHSNLLMTLDSTLSGEIQPSQVSADKARMHRYLDENPDITAFVACEYPMANILERVLRERDRADLVSKIVCFDAHSSPLAEAAYTHVLQDERGIGRTAVDVLTGNHQEQGRSPRIDLPYRIVTHDTRNELLATPAMTAD
jgi:DNA-binding LacI/PurR family transcriptional regulator